MYYFVPFFWQTIFYCMVWNIGTNSIFDELWYRKLNWISSLQVFSARHLLGRYSVGTTYVSTTKVYECAKWWHSLFKFQIIFLFFIFLIFATLLIILGTMYSYNLFYSKNNVCSCSIASRRYYSGLLLTTVEFCSMYVALT